MKVNLLYLKSLETQQELMQKLKDSLSSCEIEFENEDEVKEFLEDQVMDFIEEKFGADHTIDELDDEFIEMVYTGIKSLIIEWRTKYE